MGLVCGLGDIQVFFILGYFILGVWHGDDDLDVAVPWGWGVSFLSDGYGDEGWIGYGNDFD